MALRIQHRQLITGVNASRVLGLVLLVSGLSGQVAERQPRFSVPQDWTHSHVVFTRTVFTEHPELLNREPRVMHQFLRRLRPFLRSGIASAPEQASGAEDQPMKRDWNVSLGAGIVARGMSPAVFVFDATALPSCTQDYAAFALDVAGATGGQASLIAFNNLYSGAGGLCGTGGPSVLFSYNTTTAGGTIITSPVLSLDGAKIAFVESAAASSVFHVLNWASGPGNGASATNSAAPGVGNTASMSSLTYAPVTNTRSSPWIDYINDIAYVGADDGKLYKITGVFKGTPALAGAPWPVTIFTGHRLSGPVLDQVTGNLFLGDSQGVLFSLNANSPTTVKTLAVGLAGSQNPAIFDPPLLDADNGTVFAVSANDGTSGVVVQADTRTFTQLARGRIGQGSTVTNSIRLYDGAFDNDYLTNPATGSLFVCGTGAADNSPWRYSFGFAGRVMNTAPSSQVQILSSTRARCSPVTEFFNPNVGTGGTDFFFLGLTTDCQGRPSSGCVWSRTSSNIITTAPQSSGTSAIVVDNSSTAGQASSIYFSNQAAAGSAVKVTQNGLQ